MTCPICNGSGEAHGDYQVLNCTAEGCTAATERAALEAANKAGEPMTVYDQRWFAYHAGKAAGLEQAAKVCDLIGDDWENSGIYQKSYAAEYIAKNIREIKP